MTPTSLVAEAWLFRAEEIHALDVGHGAFATHHDCWSTVYGVLQCCRSSEAVWWDVISTAFCTAEIQVFQNLLHTFVIANAVSCFFQLSYVITCYTTSHGNHKEDMSYLWKLFQASGQCIFWTLGHRFGHLSTTFATAPSSNSASDYITSENQATMRWLASVGFKTQSLRKTVPVVLDLQIFIPAPKMMKHVSPPIPPYICRLFPSQQRWAAARNATPGKGPWRFWSTKRRPEWRFSMQPSAVPGTSCVAHAQGVWWKDFVTDYMRVAR